jgi:hypothetical protein
MELKPTTASAGNDGNGRVAIVVVIRSKTVGRIGSDTVSSAGIQDAAK